jgi:hypothetical protein
MCECQVVQAYKSKNGNLYDTVEKCKKANEVWDQEQERKRKEEIQNKAIDAIYKVAEYNGHYRRYYPSFERSPYNDYYERGYADALGSINRNWRTLRSLLNAIQD